jgi:hypothetical protein
MRRWSWWSPRRAGAPRSPSWTGEAACPDTRLRTTLPLPGVYGVRVHGDAPPDSAGYRLTARIEPPIGDARLVWPPPFVPGAGPLRDERQEIRTPRMGTPTTPSVFARVLGAPPEAIVSDFTLVADIQFEKIVGPSAFTVRFRFEPEAGGGSGYLLTVNPFGGTASLDEFEEGQRRPLVEDLPLPLMPTPDGPNRLVLTAEGPSIRATLDGQTLLEANDASFTNGLIAVGAVSWTDPVGVTFDHIQVTAPPR